MSLLLPLHQDVTTFLAWAAEPEHDDRKLMGVKWITILALVWIQVNGMKPSHILSLFPVAKTMLGLAGTMSCCQRVPDSDCRAFPGCVLQALDVGPHQDPEGHRRRRQLSIKHRLRPCFLVRTPEARVVARPLSFSPRPAKILQARLVQAGNSIRICY